MKSSRDAAWSALAFDALPDDPYPLYAAALEHGPVAGPDARGRWRVLGYHEVRRCALDARIRPLLTSTRPLMDRLVDVARKARLERVEGFFEAWVSELSSTAHRRVRKGLTRGMNPRVVAAMRPDLERIAEGLFAAAGESDGFDFVREVAFPLPILSLGRLLGLPAADMPRVKGWSDEIIGFQADNENPDALDRLYDAILEMEDYFAGAITDRRRSPQPDLISRVVATASVSDAALIANLGLFVIAGHETATGVIGNGVAALLQQPEAYARLRSAPASAGAAALESLRMEPSVQYSGRITTEPVEVAGRRIEAGAHVLLLWAAANRDPAVFTEPQRLDLERADARHLAFGAGAHYCLGAGLGQLQAEIVFDLLAHSPRMLATTGAVERVVSPQFRIPLAMPVAWVDAPATRADLHR